MIDDPGWEWVLEGLGSGVWGGDDLGSLETLGAAKLFLLGEAWEEDCCFGENTRKSGLDEARPFHL